MATGRPRLHVSQLETPAALAGIRRNATVSRCERVLVGGDRLELPTLSV